MTIKLHSPSPADTFGIGVSIGQQLKGHEIIFLKGELGAGKTLFSKGIAKALGIKPEEVVSPSFTLVNEFRVTRKSKPYDEIRLIHVDLYRLGPSQQDSLPEIDDYINEGIIVVEWAQFLPPSYAKLDHTLEITFHLQENEENSRTLEINTPLKYIKL